MGAPVVSSIRGRVEVLRADAFVGAMGARVVSSIRGRVEVLQGGDGERREGESARWPTPRRWPIPTAEV